MTLRLISFNPKDLINLESTLENQLEKLEKLRTQVRSLRFIPVEGAGYYSPIAFKSFDGGLFKINYAPLEIDIIEVADSNGRTKMKFVVPIGDDLVATDFESIEAIPIMRKFLDLLNVNSLSEASEILKDPGTLMELAEFACIFDRITSDFEEDLLIMKDGYLRTKKIKAELLNKLKRIIKERKKSIKLVGVTKSSKIVSMLSTALFIERKIPLNQTGYIKVPLKIELQAYKWSGKGKITEHTKRLDYAFGSLYICKLSKRSNMLLTVEIPEEYSTEEVTEIISYLIKDSKYSYPILGYPQTIMRAHEAAVRIGIPASITKDLILEQVKELADPTINAFLRDGWLMRDLVNKGVLGGGNWR